MNQFRVECSEVNYFTILVEAETEDEARELAKGNINSFEYIRSIARKQGKNHGVGQFVNWLLCEQGSHVFFEFFSFGIC